MVDTVYGVASLRAAEIDVYLEDDFTLTERLKINAGIHGSSFWVLDKKYFSLQPRLSARYLFGTNMALKDRYRIWSSISIC